MRNLSSFLFAAVIFLSAVPMREANADGLVPCGFAGGPICTTCHLVIGVKGVIDWGMNVMTFFAIAIITAMGIVYIVSAGNSGMMTTAKNGIKATMIGFAVMLGSWVIVNLFMTTLANNGVVSQGGKWSDFTCDTATKARQTNPTNVSSTSGVSNGGGGGAACEDIAAAKQRLGSDSIGTVCNGTGSCKRCDTSEYDSLIDSAASTSGMSAAFIKAIIARESSCNKNAVKGESDGTQSCGLMGVNTRSSSHSCEQLKDPSTGISEGVRILKSSYVSAQSLVSKYGNTVTVNELAAAIHNAGPGDSAASSQVSGKGCLTSEGWKVIPKWGCPIAPGEAEFNACDIRDYACDVGACVN